MPKQIYKITQFHGGLNENSDPRDIDENQVAAIENLDFSQLGRILLKHAYSIKDYETEPDATMTAGDEIFLIKHDKGDLHDFTAPTDLSTTYLFLGHDAADGNNYIYEKNSSNKRCMIKIQIVSAEYISTGVKSNFICENKIQEIWSSDGKTYLDEQKMLTLKILEASQQYSSSALN